MAKAIGTGIGVSFADPLGASSGGSTGPYTPDLMSAPIVTASDGAITIDRADAPSDGGSPITRYDYRIGTDQINWTEAVMASDPLTVTGRTNGVRYYVQTRAVNAVGPGEWSSSGSAVPTGVPARMAAPTLTVGPSRLTVDRDDNTNNNGSVITGYNLRYSSQSDMTGATVVPMDNDPQVIDGLTNKTTYYVQTQAVNAQGEGQWSPSASATPVRDASKPAKMDAPVLTAGARSISVDRQDGVDDGDSPITRYDLRYSTSSSFSGSTPITMSTDPQTISDLVNGSLYYVQTRAVNAIGVGDWSDAATATPVDVPGKMPTPTVTAGYRQITIDRADATDTGGSAIIRYDLTYADNATMNAATSIEMTSDPMTITDLTDDKIYYARVRAVNAVGNGENSDSASARTDPARTKPDKMTAPALTAGNAQITIDRADNTGNGGMPITRYDYRYSTDQATWTSNELTTDPQTITGLTNGSLYYVQTRAVNAVGPGDWSDSAQATPKTVPAKMAAPTATSGDGFITLDRADSTNNGGSAIQAYDYRRSTDQQNWTASVMTGDPMTVSGLTNGTLYYFQTRAVNDVGPGSWSDSVSVTPAAAVVTYDPDAQTLFNAMSTQPTATRKNRYDVLIKGLKEDGLWSKLIGLQIYAAHDDQPGRVDIKVPSRVASKVGAVGFTVNKGFVGTGSAADIIDTLIPDTAANQNNVTFGGFVTAGTDSALLWWNSNANRIMANNAARLRSTGDINISSPGTVLGMWIATRAASALAEGYYNGLKVGQTTTASSAPATGNTLLTHRSSSAASGANTIGMAFAATFMTADEVKKFYNRLNTFLVGVGASTFANAA